MRGCLPLLLAVFCAPASAAQWIACGKLFDADSARLLGAHQLLISDGRITEVRASAEPPAAAGDFIDLRDKTCLPGLIDMHVHLDGEQSPSSYSDGFRLDAEDLAYRSVVYAERTVQAGFTTVRDLGGVITLGLRDAINQGLVTGPRIVAAGKAIATTGGHADPNNGVSRDLLHALGYPGPEEGVIAGPIEARRAVRQRYKDGSDVIKITATGGVLSFAKSADNPQFMLDEIEAIVATAHDYGYKVAAHAHGAEGMKRAVLGGVDSIEHGTYMNNEVMALMKERGTWYVPTLLAGDFVSEKSKIDGFFPEIVRPKAARVGPRIADTFAKAYKAGIKIAFGTDAGVFPHGQNAREFELMVKAGMPAELAIQAATRNAAELLGQWDELGSLSVGKYADLVAVSGDPTQDITRLQHVEVVFKSGQRIQ